MAARGFGTGIRILGCCFGLSGVALAQTVQPVIVEYKGNADGKFAVTNNTLEPMVVMLEPKSFSITPEGKGVFRSLDAEIHVELSAMSVKLQPKQTYYIFYKATSERLPAWFTVYATFSAVQHGPGLDVRIMLPHTVYLYQRQALAQADVALRDVVYLPRLKKVRFTLENEGVGMARVQDVFATAPHESVEVAGFPFLPGAERTVEIDWKPAVAPTEISLKFEHFSVKHAVTIRTE